MQRMQNLNMLGT